MTSQIHSVCGYELQTRAEAVSGRWRPVLLVRNKTTGAEQQFLFGPEISSGTSRCATSVARQVGVALVRTRDPELQV
jgi:hypothetical protein